tara:strand:+ start:5 stop:1324 length:1320 start_codon:yes stop_codon:yes gene_type:complete
MVTQSELKNFVENNYGSIYKTSGGGRSQLGGQNVKSWLKKILGNRVFDLYVKYMGIKTLNTATLVPFGLILSRDYIEDFLKEDQVGGSFLEREFPFIDNQLVGTYLKLVGLSVMDLTPHTLVPLGAAMVLYDLALRDMIGGFSQKGGARNITGSSIPPGFIQKIDYSIRGQKMPEPLVHLVRKMGENNNMLQRECATGNCGKNVYTSADPVNTPKHMVKGFPSLGVETSYSNNSWTGQLLDYDIPKVPAAMAGGARRQRKRNNQKGKGSDWMASQYSRGPVNSPTMNANQFRAMNKSSQLIDNSQFTGKNMSNNAKLIIDTPLYAQNHPVQGVSSSQFAGNLEPNELFAEQRVEYGVPTSQFGGANLNKILNELEKNNKDRRKLVTCLTNQCKRKNLMNEEESKELRRQAKDKRYNTLNILNQFPTKILEKELQKRHNH